MRPVAWAVAISTAFHAAAAAWVGTREHPKHVVVPVVTTDPEPLDVVLLEDHVAVAVPARDSAKMSQGASRDSRLATEHRQRSETAKGSATPNPTAPSHSHYMTMRGGSEGEQPEIRSGVSNGFVDHFLESSKPIEAPAAPTGELHQNGRELESEHETFGARVARDGTVHLDDKPDIHVDLGCLVGGCKMALDDALMRQAGIDPYASAKRQWLEKTFEERARLGLANRKEDLARSAEYMQRNLTWMWQKTSDPGERKQALFELWDDVAETGDDDLIHGGQAARTYVVGFIRSHLPAGSPGAFSDTEVAQLNAHRRSHAMFAPYE
jgi:hypothetical protein